MSTTTNAPWTRSFHTVLYRFAGNAFGDIVEAFNNSSEIGSASCTYDTRDNVFELCSLYADRSKATSLLVVLITQFLDGELDTAKHNADYEPRVTKYEQATLDFELLEEEEYSNRADDLDNEAFVSNESSDDSASSIFSVWKPVLDQFGIDRLAGQSILNEVGLATGCQLSFDEFAQGIKIKSSGDAGIQLAKSKLFNLEWFLQSKPPVLNITFGLGGTPPMIGFQKLRDFTDATAKRILLRRESPLQPKSAKDFGARLVCRSLTHERSRGPFVPISKDRDVVVQRYDKIIMAALEDIILRQFGREIAAPVVAIEDKSRYMSNSRVKHIDRWMDALDTDSEHTDGSKAKAVFGPSPSRPVSRFGGDDDISITSSPSRKLPSRPPAPLKTKVHPVDIEAAESQASEGLIPWEDQKIEDSKFNAENVKARTGYGSRIKPSIKTNNTPLIDLKSNANAPRAKSNYQKSVIPAFEDFRHDLEQLRFEDPELEPVVQPGPDESTALATNDQEETPDEEDLLIDLAGPQPQSKASLDTSVAQQHNGNAFNELRDLEEHSFFGDDASSLSQPRDASSSMNLSIKLKKGQFCSFCLKRNLPARHPLLSCDKRKAAEESAASKKKTQKKGKSHTSKTMSTDQGPSPKKKTVPSSQAPRRSVAEPRSNGNAQNERSKPTLTAASESIDLKNSDEQQKPPEFLRSGRQTAPRKSTPVKKKGESSSNPYSALNGLKADFEEQKKVKLPVAGPNRPYKKENLISETMANLQHNKKKLPCVNYRRTGTCPQGDDCMYCHTDEVLKPCRGFQKGTCKFGSSCVFPHFVNGIDINATPTPCPYLTTTEMVETSEPVEERKDESEPDEVKPQPSSGMQDPHTDPLRAEEPRSSFRSGVYRSLDAARLFRGSIEVEIQFGMVIVDTYWPEQLKELKLEQFAHNMADRKDFTDLHSVFTNVLTTSPDDVDYMITSIYSDDDPKNIKPFKIDSLLELTCEASDKSEVRIIVDMQSPEPGSGVQISYAKGHDCLLGAVYVHAPNQTWDARCIVTGHRRFVALDEVSGAKSLHDRLYAAIEPRQNGQIPQLQGRDGDGLNVQAARIITVLKYSCGSNKPYYIEVRRVHDLLLRRPETQDVKNRGVFRADCLSDETMTSEQRLWYEFSLKLSIHGGTFKENEKMSIGSEAGWKAHEVVDEKALKRVEEAVWCLLKRMDPVGAKNKGVGWKWSLHRDRLLQEGTRKGSTTETKVGRDGSSFW